MAEYTTKFSLKFGSENSDINATTYGTILVNTVALLEEANKELQTSAHLEIKVRSERKGSFLVDLGIEPAAVLAVVAPLVTKENYEACKAAGTRIIQVASSAYELWKKVRGEKPKELKEKGEQVVVVTGDHNTVIVDKSVSNLVFQNKRAQDSLVNTFSALSKDQNVEDFAVINEAQETLFLAEKSEFPELAKSVKAINPSKQTIAEEIPLYIIRQSFDPKLKSDYLYRGIQISASISDRSFWDGVDNGAKYGKGDVLLSELEIEQVFNKALNTYENKNYTIVKVKEYMPRKEQQDLFDND